MADGDAQTTPFDVPCPRCGRRPVTLVTIGNPRAPAQKSTIPGGTVTISEGLSFLSCESCKHSWHLPEGGSA